MTMHPFDLPSQSKYLLQLAGKGYTEMSNGTFTFKIRTQFSYIVDDITNSCILSGIAAVGINITGYLQTKIFEPDGNHRHKSYNLARLVVGSAQSETKAEITKTRDVLDSLSVNFEENPIIEVLELTPGVPGGLNDIFGALWCKVLVNALYYGEETTLYVDVSDIVEALRILSQMPVEQCPKKCEICPDVKPDDRRVFFNPRASM
jgi:hypothetical protein